MSEQQNHLSRRTVLKSGLGGVGVALVGGTAVTGSAAGSGPGSPHSRGGNLVSKVNSHGHYAWFPRGSDTWGRSKHPFDTREGDSRWMAKPDARGSIRCLVTNLPANRNAGFDVHVGQLGDINEVIIDAETIQTDQSGGTAVLFVGLYLDAGDDGDFFAWNDGRGNIDTWDSFGKDSEGAIFPTANGEITIDGDTQFTLFHVGSGPNPAKLTELKTGKADGVDAETIVEETEAALYIGAASAGGGTEEIVINSLTVDRT